MPADADLHGIQFAPHGAWDGVLGLAALIQVCATLPQNLIAFEYPSGDHDGHDSFWCKRTAPRFLRCWWRG